MYFLLYIHILHFKNVCVQKCLWKNWNSFVNWGYHENIILQKNYTCYKNILRIWGITQEIFVLVAFTCIVSSGRQLLGKCLTRTELGNSKDNMQRWREKTWQQLGNSSRRNLLPKPQSLCWEAYNLPMSAWPLGLQWCYVRTMFHPPPAYSSPRLPVLLGLHERLLLLVLWLKVSPLCPINRSCSS